MPCVLTLCPFTQHKANQGKDAERIGNWKKKSATNILCVFLTLDFEFSSVFCVGEYTLRWRCSCWEDVCGTFPDGSGWLTLEDSLCYCVRHGATPEYPMNVDSRHFLSPFFVKHNGFGFYSVRKTTYVQHCCPHIHKQTHIPTFGWSCPFFFFLKKRKRNIREAHHTVRVVF